MVNRAIKGIIFDCDGVLLDSEVIYLHGLIRFLRRYGIAAGMEEVKFAVGIDLKISTQMLMRRFHISEDPEELCCRLNRYLMEDYYSLPLAPMDGLLDFLDQCDEKRIALAVASSSSADYLNYVLGKIGVLHRFCHIVSRDDVTHPKPDPEVYEKALKKLAIPKETVIAIEDSAVGIKAAKAAGLYVVGFKGSALEQDTSLADESIASFEELHFEYGGGVYEQRMD